MGVDRGELALIAEIRARTGVRNRAVRLGIGDDCAILRIPPGHEMVVTTDFSLEGRHFRRDWHTPESAGHRCLARGLSDIAAMGAKPAAAFLSLGLPVITERRWVTRFLAGLSALAEMHGVELAGGDTAAAPGTQFLADIVVVGSAARGKAMRRATARVGDRLYVTGTLGDAAVELAALATGGKCPRRAGSKGSRHTFPEPRIAVGQSLVRRGIATACMDLSDGLSTDLTHLCQASGVGAEVEAEALPLGEGATPEQALHGGEDYELLFAAPSQTEVPQTIAGVKVTCVGRLVAGAGVRLVHPNSRTSRLRPGGWEHNF